MSIMMTSKVRICWRLADSTSRIGYDVLLGTNYLVLVSLGEFSLFLWVHEGGLGGLRPELREL